MTRFAPVCFCKDGFQTALLNRNPIDLTASVQTLAAQFKRPYRNCPDPTEICANRCDSIHVLQCYKR